MGIISLSLPLSGSPDATEHPKIPANFTILQNVINGNLDDTNLASPMAAVRKTLLQAGGGYNGAITAGDYVLGSGFVSSIGGGGNMGAFPTWAQDSGLSSQPQDFQVAAKALKARTRVTLTTNGTAPGITFKVGAYTVTSVGGAAFAITVTAASAIVASQVTFTTPAANSQLTLESTEWTPSGAAGVLILGVNLSGSQAAGAFTSIGAQILGYNT